MTTSTPIPATEYLPVVAFVVGWLLAVGFFVLLVRGARRRDGAALSAEAGRMERLRRCDS